MPRARSRGLLLKSVAAMVSAIEVYNKPDFAYREETFSVLALNAWELLFKAKLLAEEGNRLSSILVYMKKTLPDGSQSKKSYIKRNRSGNAMSIGLLRAMGLLENRNAELIDNALKANLLGLSEVRDNAIHLSNESAGFAKTVHELGTAAIQNYVKAVQGWFQFSLAHYNFYLMPLAFFRDFSEVAVVALTAEEKKIVHYLAELHKDHSADDKEYSVLLELDVSLKRTAAPTAVRLSLGKDPSAIAVTLTEEDIRRQYPWDYRTLTQTLRERYSDFKESPKFQSLRKPLVKDATYVLTRHLDPGNPKSARKDFYSPNVLNIFDKQYQKRRAE